MGYLSDDAVFDAEIDFTGWDDETGVAEALEQILIEERLKREIRAEAIWRLEDAARTEADFTVVVEE